MFLRAHGRKSMPVCLEALLFLCPFVLMSSALAARYGVSPYVLCFGVLPESNILLWLTDRTDCTDSFAHATCFCTTEMTDLTDFVSIACSLRH